MGSAQPQNVSSRSLTNVLRFSRGCTKSCTTSSLSVKGTLTKRLIRITTTTSRTSWTGAGQRVSNRKVEAITKMDRPNDVPAIQRFIGLVKYLSKFLQDLSEMCEPLRHPTHKGAERIWGHEPEVAFVRIKEAVVKAPVLKYFKESHPTKCQGDASQSRVGFVVMQCRQPLTFSSRALTPAERRYSQIEKELLPHVFGMEHNHNYVYGRKVIL